MGGSVWKTHTHRYTLPQSPLASSLGRPWANTPSYIGFFVCQVCDALPWFCVCDFVTLKQLPPAARTHKVNTTSKFKHTHSYQTPPLALAHQHKQPHSYWSVWHYWGHFQFTDILMCLIQPHASWATCGAFVPRGKSNRPRCIYTLNVVWVSTDFLIVSLFVHSQISLINAGLHF